MLGSSDDLVAGGCGETTGGVSSNSGGEEENNKSFGGNRWPRQETLALLKIRSDMDHVFRESSLKGPLWEKVSRKLEELGYLRSAKKCKEKFENVYKYHKRTKDGRMGKSEGKTYRFFDQLAAFEHHNNNNNNHQPLITTTHNDHNLNKIPPTTIASNSNYMITTTSTIPSNPINYATPNIGCDHTNTNATIPIMSTITNPTMVGVYPLPVPKTNSTTLKNQNANNLFSSSTSSSTASDDDFDFRSKKKRKWKAFFRRMAKEVIDKQEELQNKFLETIDRRENERIAREEAWRIQEIARCNREHQILVQERSNAAAKDAVVTSFLQKISGQPPPPLSRMTTDPATHDQAFRKPPSSMSQPPRQHTPSQPPRQHTPSQPQPVTPVPAVISTKKNNKNDNVGVLGISPSRWPKAEIEALIRLRTNLEMKYQDNGSKGPLWEEISMAMRNIGYNRNAKRCKEKWENINKYFKKVKESSKKRPEDSKTCPYFHQLNAIYKERNNNKVNCTNNNNTNVEPLMIEPEQQWPPPQQQHQGNVVDVTKKDVIQEEEEDDDDDDDDDGVDGFDDSTGDEDEGGVYEIVANKQQTNIFN